MAQFTFFTNSGYQLNYTIVKEFDKVPKNNDARIPIKAYKLKRKR